MSDFDDDIATAERDRHRTWWERNAIPTMGVISAVMLALVIFVQVSC